MCQTNFENNEEIENLGKITGKESKDKKSFYKMPNVVQEISLQKNIAIPTTVSLVLYRLPWLISLHFAGALGTLELAAAALSTTLCNVTGMSLSVGLSSAMTTLTAQAKGEILHNFSQENGGEKVDLGTENGNKQQINGNDYEKTSLIQTETTYLYGAPNEGINEHISLLKKKSAESIPFKPLVFLYRGLFIQLAIVLPIGIWWLSGIKHMLLALGQKDAVSFMTQNYLRILVPGFWSYSINWTFSAWLQALEMADVPAYAAGVGLALHIPFNILFIQVLGFQYLGVAMATVMFQLIQPALICSYLFLTHHGRTRLLKQTGASLMGRSRITFKVEASEAIFSLAGIKQYLSLALPGVIVISEWWASEIVIFLAGNLEPFPAVGLGAMSIYQSINSSCFMFGNGLSSAASTRVGTLLGKKDKKGVDLAAKVSVVGAVILGVIMGCILFFTPHTFFPSLFTSEEDVVFQTSKTITLLSFYVFADGIQVTFNGIVKGCGRQAIVMPIVIFAYWIVGLPLAYYISFIKYEGKMCNNSYFCGIPGLVAGITTGTWVHMLLLAGVVISTTNWTLEIGRAEERMNIESNNKENGEFCEA